MPASNRAKAVVLLCTLAAAVTAFVLEPGRRKRMPGTLPYTWGIFQGASFVIAGAACCVLGLAFLIKGDLATTVAVLLVGLPFMTVGFFAIRRYRWAWVVTTIATLNPILWVADFVNGSNRWEEFKSGPADEVSDRPAP